MEETKQQLPTKQEVIKDKIQIWIEKWFGLYVPLFVRTCFSFIIGFILIYILNAIIGLSKTVSIIFIITISMLLSPFMHRLKFLDTIASKIIAFYVKLYTRNLRHERK